MFMNDILESSLSGWCIHMRRLRYDLINILLLISMANSYKTFQ